jgi:ribosomal-protein-serine acetyltransferase
MNDRSASKGATLRYASSVAEVGVLEPIWNALQAHHEKITPELGPATPKRDALDAWRIRRTKYERWLENPGTFFVVAEVGGEPVGYAFVTIGLPYASWAAGEHLAELETLSVLPDHRGEGVGAALLDAVWKRLAELGVEDMQITTTVTNVDAQRFYEREGFRQRFAVYYRKTPDHRPRSREPERHSGCGAWWQIPGGSALRALEIDDAEELHALIEAERQRLAPSMPWAGAQTFDDTVTFLARARRQQMVGDGFQLAVIRDDRIVGVVGHHGVDWTNRSTALGYWLAATEQGKGTMTEAVRTLVDHAFSTWRLNRIEIRAASDNLRSLAIPRRLGFTYEGTLRRAERLGDRYVDLAVYSLLAERS